MIRRRLKIPFWLGIAIIALLILIPPYILFMTGIRGSRIERAEALTARVKKENPAAFATPVWNRPPGALPSDQAAAAPPGEPRGAALVREMYDLFRTKVVEDPEWSDWPSLDPAERERFNKYTPLKGKPDYSAGEKLDEFAAIHAANIGRLDELVSLADEWGAIKSWVGKMIAASDMAADKKLLSSGSLSRFENYLFQLEILRLRPYWKADDTAGLARALLGSVPLARMFDSTDPDRYYYSQSAFAGSAAFGRYQSKLGYYLTSFLQSGPVAFRRGDWAGLDWSPLLAPSKEPDIADSTKKWDQDSAWEQEHFLEDSKTLSKRFDYNYTLSQRDYLLWGIRFSLSCGHIYDQMTDWREKGHDFLAQPRSYEEVREFFSELPILRRRIIGGAGHGPESKIESRTLLKDPSDEFLGSVWIVLQGRFVDMALRLLRGETIPSNPSRESPFFATGYSCRVVKISEGVYKIEALPVPPVRNLGNAPEPRPPSPSQFDPEPDGRAGYRFRSAEPLVQPAELAQPSTGNAGP